MLYFKFPYLTFVISVLLSFFAVAPAEAIFTSAKALGMAAAVAAYPQDSLVVAYNPAGITDVGNRFDGGLNYLTENGHAKFKGNLNPLVNGNFNGKQTKDIIAPDFGVCRQFCYDITLGFAVYNRTYLKTTYDQPLALLGTTKAGAEYIHETIAGTVAWKPNCWHSFAVSLNYMIQRFKVNGVQNFENPVVSAFPEAVTNRGYNYSRGVGATIAWLGHFSRYFSVGISYQFHTHMSSFSKYKGLLADKGKFDIPSYTTFGIAIHPLCNLTLTFDVQFIGWREIRALKNSALDNLFINKTGTKNGPGFGWRNQTLYRFGLAYQFNREWMFRLGFRHGKNPIKRASTLPNVLTLECVEDYLTAGFTWTPCCSYEVSGYVGYAFEKSVHGTELPLTTLGGGTVDLNQNQFITGISLGYLF